jgi:hypothetical protein
MAKIQDGLQKALLAERKKRLCHVTWWDYKGVHDAGKDFIVSDPHDIGLQVAIVATAIAENWTENLMAYRDDVKLLRPLTGEFFVTRSKPDNFKQQVKVAGTKEAWQQLKAIMNTWGC